MREIIRNLFYMVDEWAERQTMNDPEMKELLARRDALQDEIALRLGEDGWEMMESLAGLGLEMKDIHDEALFRAAMRLGTQIAQPAGAHPEGRTLQGRAL